VTNGPADLPAVLAAVLPAVLPALLGMRAADEEIEGYLVHRRTTTVYADTGGAIRQVDRSETLGIGVRVVSSERCGYASTSDLSTAGLTRCVEQARSFARLSEPLPGWRLPGPEIVSGVGISPTAASVSVADQRGLTTALARQATALDGRVQVIDGAACSSEWTSIEIASTTGVRTRQERAFVDVWLDVVGDDGSVSASGAAYWRGRDLTDCDPALVAAEAVEHATRLLGPRIAMPTGTAVLCGPDVMAVFITAAGRSLDGPSIRSGRGPLAAGLGDQVAASCVTLVDDGLHANAKRAGSFDDEGMARKRTPLITAGIVSGTLGTGNAYRGSYKSAPSIAPTTLVLTPTAPVADPAGLANPADLAGLRGDVVYIAQLAGDRSGISAVTGRIDVAATGYLLRDGEPVGAFVAAPVTTTLLDVLRHVSAVGDDGRPVYGSAAMAPTTRLDAGWLQ
jgi:PmbA protein